MNPHSPGITLNYWCEALRNFPYYGVDEMGALQPATTPVRKQNKTRTILSEQLLPGIAPHLDPHDVDFLAKHFFGCLP